MELLGIIFKAFLGRNKQRSNNFLYLLFLFWTKIKESFFLLFPEMVSS
jgi:hypothetical protein